MSESNVLRLAKIQTFLDKRKEIAAESKSKTYPNNFVNTTAKSFAFSGISCLPYV